MAPADPIIPCFNVGSIVRCINCFDEEITGEVAAFDYRVKTLTLKCARKNAAGDPQQQLCDLVILNLAWCKDVDIVQEAKSPALVLPPAPLNLPRIQKRMDTTKLQRNFQMDCNNALATPLGQALYKYLAKHFGQHSLCWQNETSNIQVLKQAIIAPPYGAQQLSALGPCTNLMRCLRRLLNKFHAQAQLPEAPVDKGRPKQK